MSADLTLIVAGDPGQLTGGYVYDARIVAALRDLGWHVDVIGLEGRFPDADETARQAMGGTLSALPDGARVVIDGLAMGGLPGPVSQAAHRLDITALIHHPLADETGLDETRRMALLASETRALAAVGRVIVTSDFTARRLASWHVPPEQIAVVEPGVVSAPLAASATDGDDAEREQRLLCVATVTPRKGHDLLIEALAGLKDRHWRCDCVGGRDRDPSHDARVARLIHSHALDSRIVLQGERSPDNLEAFYAEADLFVLPSYYEGYGMVVTEALAHGLPVLTTTGGALAHTLAKDAGAAVPPGDIDALGDALRRWLDSPQWRRQLRHGARQARDRLPRWQDAGQAFADALLRSPVMPSGGSS
ncbi:glycosyltransferase family 4 protein [Aidingimonas halophila]|uniref:Glycosyl transferases group 1 n=1 Tax=Aidingimonas halophila TaxID=574349 RepID=A0A1H3ECW9_9GAMM|nr:glycosyltransferase family 4 protein [Aidingimonas halophila]GHC33812.1 glycosyl transferase [Aidingimonas halophila]SDX75764.1 Glycosyl transferases group 1 [Aidingimonas halophila]